MSTTTNDADDGAGSYAHPMVLIKKLRAAVAEVSDNASLDEETGCYIVSPGPMQALLSASHPKTEKCPYCNSEAQTTGHSYNCKCSNPDCKMYSHWMPISFWNAGAAHISQQVVK